MMESGILQSGRAVLLSTNRYTKDGDIAVHPMAEPAAGLMQQAIGQQLINGLHAENIVWLNNEPDVVRIKEQIAIAAEQAGDLLLIYIAGTAILRRGQIYITLPYSTQAQIHVNGISIQELADIIREPEGAHKVFVLDCHFSGDAPDMVQAVREELHRHAAKLKKSFLIAQPWQEGRETLGQQISRILREGMMKPQEWLTLEDIYQELSENAQRNRQPEPLMAAKKQSLGVAIAPNQRYKEFQRLFAEARQAFDAQDFSLALTYFSQAQGLYANNDDTATHIRFINRFQEAEQFYAQKQYILARRAYEAAFELIPVPFLLEKIERCTADLANHYFELQQYDQAKAAYARLVSDHPGDTFYAERLQISSSEQRYHDLIDKADNHYFRFEFVEALEAYREALTIHTDIKTERRAQECQRYVDVLVYLQQKAETDVRARIEEEMQQKADAIIAERVAQLQKELTARIEQEITLKMQQQYDTLVWDAALQSNQRAAVELYRSVFPNGAYIDQSDYWLSLHEEPAPVEKVVEPPKEQPSIQPVFEPTYKVAQPEQTEKQESAPQPTAEVFKDEETLWNEALGKDTIEGYMAYIAQTSDSEHIADAYYRISLIRNATAQIEEETPAYAQPTEETPAFAYNNGSHEEAPAANSFVYEAPVVAEPIADTTSNSSESHEENLWQQALSANTLQAYQDYLNRSSLNKYESQAKERISELQEKEKMQETLEWEMASREDSLEAYKAYINKYPFGNYYAKARFRIARLESEIN
jgi:methionine salvage enolase-phosphatase E1